MSERLISPEQLADRLGLPLATIYQWRYKSVGPVGMKIGRHVRYAPEAIEAWLRDQRDERPAN